MNRCCLEDRLQVSGAGGIELIVVGDRFRAHFLHGPLDLAEVAGLQLVPIFDNLAHIDPAIPAIVVLSPG